MKKPLVVVIMILLALGTAGSVFAADKVFKGTITGISGNNMTISNSNGEKVTIEKVKNLQLFKVGDRVTVNGNKVAKEWGPASPSGKSSNVEVSPELNPQPEPPLPVIPKPDPPRPSEKPALK